MTTTMAGAPFLHMLLAVALIGLVSIQTTMMLFPLFLQFGLHTKTNRELVYLALASGQQTEHFIKCGSTGTFFYSL